MNPLVMTTVAGDVTTKWRRIAVVIIVGPVEMDTLRELTNPRLLPARCRLFRRMRVPAARIPAARILVARILVARILVDRDHIEVHRAVCGKYIEYLSGKVLNSLKP